VKALAQIGQFIALANTIIGAHPAKGAAYAFAEGMLTALNHPEWAAALVKEFDGQDPIFRELSDQIVRKWPMAATIEP
jgi:hypothetical protein